MSAEINITTSLVVSKDGATISTGTLSKTIDMSGADMATFTQVVGTSNEIVGFPADVSGDVHVVVKNLNATNYVEIFKDSGNSHLLSKLNPGEFCHLTRVPSTTSLYARANTDSVSVQVWISEA